MMELRTYAVLRGLSYQGALEECREANALYTEGSKILVDTEKINKYLHNEIIDELVNLNSLEVV